MSIAINITDPRAVNFWIVKIKVFKGLTELLSQIPVAIVKRKNNPLPIIFNTILI